jgi:hypothetical protein
MFSLFAPIIAESFLIGLFSQWKEIKIDRESNGCFTCSSSISVMEIININSYRFFFIEIFITNDKQLVLIFCS